MAKVKDREARHPTKKELDAKRKAIDACRDALGRVIPELVVEAATDPKSPLHPDFEWDNSRAAHLHRLERARQLIREVRVTVTIDSKKYSAPYYVSDPAGDSAYIPVTSVRKNAEQSEAVLMDELRRIESAIVRARSLAAAFDMVDEFDKMLATVVEIRGRMKGPHGTYGELEARA